MYLVNINDTDEFGVNLREVARGRWRANLHDGVEVELEFKGRDADGRFVFRVDGHDRLIKIDGTHGAIALSDGIEAVNVDVRSAADVVLEDLGKRRPEIRREDNLKSPITGIVLESFVKRGQNVKAGDPMIVVEAMKMENVLVAPRDGRVEEVVVEAGQTVFVDEVLIRLEPK